MTYPRTLEVPRHVFRPVFCWYVFMLVAFFVTVIVDIWTPLDLDKWWATYALFAAPSVIGIIVFVFIMLEYHKIEIVDTKPKPTSKDD